MYDADKPLKVQEVGDVIIMPVSDQAPFARLLKRGKKPANMLSEWPMQLPQDRGFAGIVDGLDQTTYDKTTRDKAEAYGMILRSRGWMVSQLANVTEAHGVGAKEKAKQKADDATEFALMLEKQLLANVDTRAEAGGGVTYRSRGAAYWLQNGAYGVKPIEAGYRVPTACDFTSPLDEFDAVDMEAMVEAAAIARKKPVDLVGYVGLKLKARMSSWAQRVTTVANVTELARTTLQPSDDKLKFSVNFFEFDGGMVKAIPSFYLGYDETTGAMTDYSARSGLFLNMDMWELSFLQPIRSVELEDKGGGPRGFHDGIYILKCACPLGQLRVWTQLDT
jgi:hypothetical protein